MTVPDARLIYSLHSSSIYSSTHSYTNLLCLSTHPCACLSNHHLPIQPSTYPSSTQLFTCLSVHPCSCPSAHHLPVQSSLHSPTPSLILTIRHLSMQASFLEHSVYVGPCVRCLEDRNDWSKHGPGLGVTYTVLS